MGESAREARVDDYTGPRLVRNKRGLWIRANDYGDQSVASEVSSYRKLHILPGDVVLDVGAHIGAFTVLVALPRGALMVVAVEPSAENFAVLKRNAASFKSNVKLLPGAVVHGHERTVTLQLCARMSSMHTLVPTRGREGEEVRAYCFSELLKRYQPAVIKMDIEGGEFALIEDLAQLPECVEALAIEIHPYKGDDRKTREHSRRLVDVLARQFTVVKAPRITEKNWITTGIYARGKRSSLESPK